MATRYKKTDINLEVNGIMMHKKKLIGAVRLVLLSYFCYYMLVDDELSKNAEYLLSHAEPTNNLDKNIFIHLAALSNNNYETSKQRYIATSEKAILNPSEFDNQFTFPSLLIHQEELTSDLYCVFGEEGCLENITENKELLFDLLSERMLIAQEVILSQSKYDFKPLDPISTRGDFDGYLALNYLVGLQVYKNLLEGNTTRSEELLIKHFDFARKLAEGSLDMVSSVVFVVSIQQHFQPLLEKLASTGHQFTYPINEIFNELSMTEISFKKMAISEFAMMHRAVNSYIKPNDYVDSELNNELAIYIGYKPIATLNRMADFWISNTIPETTPKDRFFEVNGAKPSNQPKVDAKNPITIILNNPRNFIGELLLAVSTPRFLDASEDYAAADLNLLLFRLLIESQQTSIVELVAEPKFKDPYTGNAPYIEESKVCYPAWVEDNEKIGEGGFKPLCIKLPDSKLANLTISTN